MNEFETLLRLALIMALYRDRPDMIRARCARLVEMASPDCRAGVALISLSKNPGAVIQRAVDNW